MKNHKINTWGTALITTGLLAASWTGYAQGTAPEGAEDRRAQFLERYDLNGDGEVTREEIQSVRAENAATRVATFMENHDLNQDGVITVDELVIVAADKAAERQAELLAKYDLNSDGTVTPEESLAVIEAEVDERVEQILARLNGEEPEGEAPERPRRPRGNRPNLDLNDDGEVTEEEVLVAAATMVVEMQARFTERHDENGDGLVTADELGNVSDEAIMERIEDMLNRLDSDENGEITEAEVAENLNARRGSRPERGPRPGGDANVDGEAPTEDGQGAPQRPQARRGGPRRGR